jgi:hypothetical protein
MPEYLRFKPDNTSNPEANLGFTELISFGKILAPAYLGTLLVQTRTFLIETPGENQAQRKLLVPKWLDYWIDLASGLAKTGNFIDQKLIPHPNIVSLDQMAEKFKESDKFSGIWNMATGEGSPAHRLIWQRSMAKAPAGVGLLFENDLYFDQHPGRRHPCLTQAMRASMAAYFGLLVSVAPDRTADISESDHYRKIFDISNATVNFTTKQNQHWQDIFQRNHPDFQHLVLIPTIPPHLSDIAEKIMPEKHTFDYKQHTSDFSRLLTSEVNDELSQLAPDPTDRLYSLVYRFESVSIALATLI